MVGRISEMFARSNGRHAVNGRHQQAALPGTLGQRPVGANHTPPRQVGLVALKQHRACESRRTRRDVAVGTDETLRNLAHALEHFELAGLRRSGQLTVGPKASMIRFWNSLSSSGEMK